MDREQQRGLITAAIRGESDVNELTGIGVVFDDDGALHTIESPGGLPVVEPSIEDLALGLYSNWARSTTQHEWARFVLGGLFIDLSALEDRPEGERILEMISDVSAGRELTDSDIQLVSSLLDSAGDNP